MKNLDLWKIFVQKNPSFEGSDTITLKTSSLRKLFDVTWDQAHSAGFENGKAYAEMHRKPERDDSLFARVFGSRL